MSDYIEIQWTSGSLDEARKISRYLVQERLVACSQIIPWVESIYMWNNQLETSQESKILMKAKKEHWQQILSIILENHGYDVPEITYRPIEGGHEEYMNWVKESCNAEYNF